MRYRIKIITFSNGRKGYYAQVRKLFHWSGLCRDGESGYAIECESRKNALTAIDLHYEGNYRKQTIEFEYITRP